MNGIFKLLFELFLIYLAYKLIFDFIIPVYKTSRQVKQKMNEMQERMREQQKQQDSFNNKPASGKGSKAVSGDYIDYEEVK